MTNGTAIRAYAYRDRKESYPDYLDRVEDRIEAQKILENYRQQSR